LPDELALYLVAYADATVAEHTAGEVHMNVRMGIVTAFDVRAWAPARPDAIRFQVAMKLSVGTFRDGLGGIVGSQQPEHAAPEGFKRRGMGDDLHAVGQLGVAGGRHALLVADLNRTQATATAGFETVVVAEGGNVEAGGAYGL
jgi:hypothetical protein